MDFVSGVVAFIFALALIQAVLPAIIQLADSILIAILKAPFRVLGLGWRSWRTGAQQLSPYELTRRRAITSAFVLVLGVYLLRTGAWPLGVLPPWGPVALLVVVGVSALFVLAACHGTRNGPRDLSATVASLVIAGGSAALLWWQWYLPPSYGVAGDTIDQWLPGFTRAVSLDGNQLLPGIYIAVLIAALMRAMICVQFLGGAARIVARAMRRRATPMRPVSVSSGGFWGDMRESFERGRAGLRWRN